MAIQSTAPKLSFLVRSKSETKPLSKTLKYIFIIFHVVFALDFGFIKFKSWKINALIKLILMAQSTVIFLILTLAFLDPNFRGVHSYTAFFLDVLVYYVFTFTLMVAKNKFHDYQNDLHSFDAEIKIVSSTYRIEYQIIVSFFILVLYRIVMFYLYVAFSHAYTKFSMYIQFIYYYFTLVGFDTVIIVYTYVFYSGYQRLQNFTAFVKKDGTDVISSQYLYKSLTDMIETVKKPFDVVLILTLLANTTDATVHVYFPFANEEIMLNNKLDVSVAYMIVAQQLLMLFSPAFTAGLLAGQVEKLRLVLYDKLIADKTRAKDIKRFVGYIDGRPLRFKVWRVVPLDWRLPVIVLNIAVTYLIVMIQFTHNH